MTKMMKRIFALCGVFGMLAALMGICYAAPAAEVKIEYTDIRIYIQDEPVTLGLKVEEITYVPVRAFCEALSEDIEVAWNQETQTATVEMPGLLISMTADEDYFTANDRCFYLPNGIFNLDGSLVAPIRELARMFNAEISWNSDNWTVEVNTDELAPIENGDTYYNQDDLYWLSHVIFSEAGNQPLEGMIGVGNVVMNRAADPIWPDTIYDVIFQRGQFDVVTYGSINMEPSEKAIVAAKIALEGYNTVGESRYFLNPETSSAAWFDENCAYVNTIGDHAFYA